MGLAEKLRNLDGYTSVSNEFRVRTAQGAFFSVATIVAIAYLIRSEAKYNFQTTILDRVHVNATSPAGLQVEFDVTFPSVPCALLSVDANDPAGQQQSLHIDRSHRVWKHRLDSKGRMIGRKSRFELGGTLKDEEGLESAAMEAGVPRGTSEKLPEEEECGSCYGAGDPDECCNTCDDVKRAYQRRGWHLSDLSIISQCKLQVKSSEEEGEGCNVHGIVALSTGGGNLHFAPGRGLERFGQESKESNPFQSIADFIAGAFETFNVSHTINVLRFGEEYPGHVHQLDGHVKNIEDAYGMYQYYIQIVPTTYRYLDGTVIETNQYSVTEHMRHVAPGSNRGLPGVFFFYEVSALHVDIEEYRRGYVHFFTSVCAVVGGVFTVMGMIDGFVYDKLSGRAGGGRLAH